MRLLLDTQALIWLFDGNPRLTVHAKSKLDTAASVLVSEATLWEIAIKVSKRRLQVPPGLRAAIREFGIERIGISDRHLARLEQLPFHHGDPFDRMLIAQALSDDLAMLTSDRAFAQYGVTVVDAGP